MVEKWSARRGKVRLQALKVDLTCCSVKIGGVALLIVVVVGEMGESGGGAGEMGMSVAEKSAELPSLA
eukprot:2629758-Amphidinium_carterae.3